MTAIGCYAAMRNVYCIAFGEIEVGSPIWNRAERLEEKFGRPKKEYLDQWGEFQWRQHGFLPLAEIRIKRLAASETA